jgi:hypothetical protein
VPDQLAFFDAYSRSDTVEAGVMLRPFRNSRKRMRVDTDHPPPTHDAVNARHRTMQVAARIVEAAADPASYIVEIEVLAAPATYPAQKPRPRGSQSGCSTEKPVRGDA